MTAYKSQESSRQVCFVLVLAKLLQDCISRFFPWKDSRNGYSECPKSTVRNIAPRRFVPGQFDLEAPFLASGPRRNDIPFRFPNKMNTQVAAHRTCVSSDDSCRMPIDTVVKLCPACSLIFPNTGKRNVLSLHVEVSCASDGMRSFDNRPP